jgi:FAD/FMN-containing dehydrogenase
LHADDKRVRVQAGMRWRDLQDVLDPVNLALAHEGRYYLPYQLHATPQQFARAYPEAAALRELKHAVDPTGRFSNELWAHYL